ncbi:MULTISPECIES: caspase family protein [unclassified Streptomyces]|uniref:caspase family protein n=1 Tax=unclassified Streptomyces TaxID=2593676 RepID=UPI001BE907C6|nr:MULTISPECIES: caspase family protein [unclassified Streptomyces]MBT2406584.1 caspase family protein [Streptomyces sp. ISL-21]MBT2608922.1 caspase family protein [Streptomyces sp. ISL-87]
MPTGISLHVGLNRVDPTKYEGWDGQLVACENDARDMAALARASGFEDTLVLTEKGTADNITAELRKAAKRLKSGDILLFTYSGHGGQMANLAGGDIEVDRQDETLVFFDRQFLDDELYREFQQLAEGVRVFVLLDCCHSGTAIESVRETLTPQALEAQFQTADPGQIEAAARMMPWPKQQQLFERDRDHYEKLQRELKAAKANNGRVPDAILIAACQDNQVASDGSVNGLFTERLLKAWDKGGFLGGYREFHRGIQKIMPPNQSPNFYTTGTPSQDFLDQKPFSI